MSSPLVCPSQELPPLIKCQLLAYLRMEWPALFAGERRFQDFTVKETHPLSFYLAEQEVLISHTEVNWRYLEHHREIYKVYGLSAVFTYPPFRREGHGRRVVEAATAYIQASDADVAMLFCAPERQNFYRSCGWTPLPGAQVFYGSQAQPRLSREDVLLMLFVSAKGQQAGQAFERQPIYVGARLW
ncbi:MAG: GNAT family N-acetyltransferase [Anaerolineae bacterium]